MGIEFTTSRFYSHTSCRCATTGLKYLLKFIFSFLRSGVKDERGVEFYHPISNASRIRQNVGNEGIFIRNRYHNTRVPGFPLPPQLCAPRYSVKLDFLNPLLHIKNKQELLPFNNRGETADKSN